LSLSLAESVCVFENMVSMITVETQREKGAGRFWQQQHTCTFYTSTWAVKNNCAV